MKPKTLTVIKRLKREQIQLRQPVIKRRTIAELSRAILELEKIEQKQKKFTRLGGKTPTNFSERTKRILALNYSFIQNLKSFYVKKGSTFNEVERGFFLFDDFISRNGTRGLIFLLTTFKKIPNYMTKYTNTILKKAKNKELFVIHTTGTIVNLLSKEPKPKTIQALQDRAKEIGL